MIKVNHNVPICNKLPCPKYGPSEPVDGVVELNSGEAKRLKIREGDIFRVEKLL